MDGKTGSGIGMARYNFFICDTDTETDYNPIPFSSSIPWSTVAEVIVSLLYSSSCKAKLSTWT